MTPIHAKAAGLALFLCLSLPAAAQHSGHDGHRQGMDHSQHMQHGMAQADGSDEMQARPTETGQSAFAAIAEIVAMLSADPTTDWRKVDIDALRAHLRDMDLVTLRSSADMTPLDDGARFEITGDGAVGDAVRRMTLAHAPFLEAEGPWRVEAEAAQNGAIMTVRAEDPTVAQKIRALGYYGLMALGAHHQPHHWAMARGDGASVHKH